MKVALFNAYSGGNRGDGLIVGQMILLLEAKGHELVLVSDDPADHGRYTVPVLPPLVRTWGRRGTRAKLLMVREAISAQRLQGPTIRALLECDLAIAVGGGYLYDDGTRGSRLNLGLRLFASATIRRLGLPVVYFSQSIGPFASRTSRRLTMRELRRADMVIARGDQSASTVARSRIRVETCDDIAFTLQPSDPPSGLPHPAASAIAVTVLGTLPGHSTPTHQSYVDSLVEALARVSKLRKIDITLVSQVSAHSSDDDVPLCRNIVVQLRELGVSATFADLRDATDSELAGYYGQFDVVIASRLHSGIIALAGGTPVVGLAYLSKTREVLERVGLAPLVHDCAGLRAGPLLASVSTVLDDLDHWREVVKKDVRLASGRAARAIDLALSVT